jgi:RNA-directed DNA polymerase
LADHRSRPDQICNRIPDDVRGQIIGLALELPELSPRELAVRFTDERRYFVSEASVYRLLKAHDLIPSPAYVVIKAANEFKDKITGWGWSYFSTVLTASRRYIVNWKLCATMCASDVTATLVRRSGHRALIAPPSCIDRGSCRITVVIVANDLAAWLKDKGCSMRGAPPRRLPYFGTGY